MGPLRTVSSGAIFTRAGAGNLRSKGEDGVRTPRTELDKIPEICSQKPCYFDLLKTRDRDRDEEFVKSLAESKCPKVCPKYDHV